MQTSLSHLPKNKQTELKKIVQLLREQAEDAVMIILYGSYARGEYKEEKDLAPNRRSGHVSDYDILVITGAKNSIQNLEIKKADGVLLAKNMSERFLAKEFSAFPSVIVHTIDDVNPKLAQAHYFFTDIKNEGCLLYDSGEFTLAEVSEEYLAEEKRLIKVHFENSLTNAKDFFEIYELSLLKNKFKKSAFLLNQATEAAYKTTLHVFNNYIPLEHSLFMLSKQAENACSELMNIFPRTTKEEKRLFDLLDYAYIGARYDIEFVVEKDELLRLASYVKVLLEKTEKACELRILN